MIGWYSTKPWERRWVQLGWVSSRKTVFHDMSYLLYYNNTWIDKNILNSNFKTKTPANKTIFLRKRGQLRSPVLRWNFSPSMRAGVERTIQHTKHMKEMEKLMVKHWIRAEHTLVTTKHLNKHPQMRHCVKLLSLISLFLGFFASFSSLNFFLLFFLF